MDKSMIFAPKAIIRYPSGFKPENLKHKFSPDSRLRKDGRPIDFARVETLINGMKADISAEYKKETGKEFNSYRLGDSLVKWRERYLKDPRLLGALWLLGQENSESGKINVPWWNEIAASELGHSIGKDGAMVTIAPRHSYETQLMRAGVEIDVRNISVGGIVIANDGWIAIGLRGGVSYSNTYHINAGALGLSPGIMNGTETICDFFLREELAKEFGIVQKDVSGVEAGSRVEDSVTDKGTMYVFHVRAKLSFDEIRARHERNADQDKGEHTRLVKIQDSPEAVWDFVRENYRGSVKNRDGRRDSERFLLHPGALALAAYAKRSAPEVASLYREGEW